MTNWFKLRPMLVMVMLFIAPTAAIAHLLLTWAPATFTLQRLSRSAHRDAETIAEQIEQLEQLRLNTKRLKTLAVDQGDVGRSWLPRREHSRVSDLLAETLQGDGVTLEQLVFNQAGLYGASPEGGVLACEQVTVVCHGPYAGLTDCLDRLAELDLPIRIVQVAWQRTEQNLALTMEMQIPFVPEGALETILREEAGLEEEEEDEL